MRNKIIAGTEFKIVKAEDGSEQYIAEHVISTDSTDRDRERVIFSDLDKAVANYRKNPVVLFYHNMADEKLPVGKNLELWRDGNKIMARTQFAVDEDEPGFVRTLWNLYKGGYLNAWSVGFTFERYEYVEDEKDPDYGKADARVYVDELLEYSVVPVPANQEALTMLAKALDGSGKRVSKQGPRAVVTGFATMEAALKSLRAEVKSLEDKGFTPSALVDLKSASREVTWTARELASLAERAKATPTDLAPPDTEWDWDWTDDANAIIEKGGWKLLASAVAYVDLDYEAEEFEDDKWPMTKDAYYLPFKRLIGGKLQAVWRGVAAAMTALLGGRGGPDLTDEQRREAYDKLVTYYEAFEKEPPDFKGLLSIENERLETALAKTVMALKDATALIRSSGVKLVQIDRERNV